MKTRDKVFQIFNLVGLVGNAALCYWFLITGGNFVLNLVFGLASLFGYIVIDLRVRSEEKAAIVAAQKARIAALKPR